jgi:hypothetical protein
MTDTDTPERELIERLREPDTHDPACPFRLRCYCDEGSPHDNVQDDDKLEAADTIEALLSRVDKLEEALNAIIDRAPERNIKWAGMTARDIAIHALNRSAGHARVVMAPETGAARSVSSLPLPNPSPNSP